MIFRHVEPVIYIMSISLSHTIYIQVGEENKIEKVKDYAKCKNRTFCELLTVEKQTHHRLFVELSTEQRKCTLRKICRNTFH